MASKNTSSAYEYFTLTSDLKYYAQACDKLGVPGGAKSFLRGVQSFKTMYIFLKCVQRIFPGGEKKPAPFLNTGLIMYTNA